MEMDPEVAGGMAEHALGFFGFYDRIIDNALEPTDVTYSTCSKIMTFFYRIRRNHIVGRP